MDNPILLPYHGSIAPEVISSLALSTEPWEKQQQYLEQLEGVLKQQRLVALQQQEVQQAAERVALQRSEQQLHSRLAEQNVAQTSVSQATALALGMPYPLAARPAEAIS